MDIFSTPSSVLKAGFRQEQERDPKTGKWVKEAGAHLDRLRQRLKPGMSSKDSASLKRDVKSHIKALHDQLKAARDLHNKIGAKPKPWWQLGAKPSDRPTERIAAEMGRKGYRSYEASNYLYGKMMDEGFYGGIHDPVGRAGGFHKWLDGALSEVPASVVMSWAMSAPTRGGAGKQPAKWSSSMSAQYKGPP